MNAITLLELLSQVGIAVALTVLGLLSRRLGRATQAKPGYWGFFAAAALVISGAALRLLNGVTAWWPLDTLDSAWLPVLIYNGLPALGVTLGIIFAWRYWSWLLAENG
ncbi:MAG: hypothetical protein SF162_17810 [bacterium]|nr:hypothetical protein [bacterium]